jgi:hypothetical protein
MGHNLLLFNHLRIMFIVVGNYRTHPEQAPISPDHLREHFMHGVSGTIADGARLDIEIVTEIDDPYVQEIILDSIDVED